MRKETTLQMVYRHPLFTKEQIQIISESHKEVRFKKGNFFLTKGEIANSFLLLEEGLMRSFLTVTTAMRSPQIFTPDQEVGDRNVLLCLNVFHPMSISRH